MIVNLAFAATLLFAQTPSPTPRPTPTPPTPATLAQRQIQRLTTLLDLTTAQQTDALPIFTTAATTALSVSSSMQTARKALRTDILNNNTTNIGSGSAPGVDAMAIGNLTAQLTAAEAVAQAAFYQILTPAQQTKYNTLGQRGGMGGAGPMGFGPGGAGPGPGGMGPGQGFRGGH